MLPIWVKKNKINTVRLVDRNYSRVETILFTTWNNINNICILVYIFFFRLFKGFKIARKIAYTPTRIKPHFHLPWRKHVHKHYNPFQAVFFFTPRDRDINLIYIGTCPENMQIHFHIEMYFDKMLILKWK